MCVCEIHNDTLQTDSYGSMKIQPLYEYIEVYNTRYTDRKCWMWAPCGSNDYIEQLPVHDGRGFLTQVFLTNGLSYPVCKLHACMP